MNHNMIDVCDELWMLYRISVGQPPPLLMGEAESRLEILKTLIEAHRVAVAEDRPL